MITIRPATEDDLPEMVNLLNELFSIEADFAPERNRQERGLRMMLSEPDSHPIFVACGVDDKAVGMATCQVTISTAQGSRVGVVEDVVISRGCRRQGIGKRLLDTITDWAKTNGLTRLQLLCDLENQPAIDFYEKEGWRSTQLICKQKLL